MTASEPFTLSGDRYAFRDPPRRLFGEEQRSRPAAHREDMHGRHRQTPWMSTRQPQAARTVGNASPHHGRGSRRALVILESPQFVPLDYRNRQMAVDTLTELLALNLIGVPTGRKRSAPRRKRELSAVITYLVPRASSDTPPAPGEVARPEFPDGVVLARSAWPLTDSLLNYSRRLARRA